MPETQKEPTTSKAEESKAEPAAATATASGSNNASTSTKDAPAPAPAATTTTTSQPAPAASGSDPSHHEQTLTGIVPADPEDDDDPEEFELQDVSAEGYETDGRSSASTSITSSVYAHTIEHGRRYQHFKNGRYPIPNDEDELNREDMKHAMLMELCDGQLFYSPVENVQKVLDIGTGTGIWAIEMGDRYPAARVRGIDISPVQPVWVPPNVDFLVDDCEVGEWLDKDVDLVHFRFMTPVLKQPKNTLTQAYQSLKPGGWLELQELAAEILCDDGSMPEDDGLKYAYELLDQSFTKFGMNLLIPKTIEPILREIGFVNIQCMVKKVPIGPWARDKTLRVVGMYQQMAVEQFLPALAGRPLAALGFSPVEAQVIAAKARATLNDRKLHRHFHYYFWMAQKPQ